MTSRSLLLAGAVILLFLLGHAGAEAPADAQEFSPQQLHAQVAVLQVAGALQLTTQQISEYIPLLQQVNQNREQVLSQADVVWNQYGPAIQQVAAAGMAGQPASAEVGQNAQSGLADFTQQRDAFRRLLESAAVQLVGSLTQAQRQLIEDARAPERQVQIALELEGAQSVPEYIVRILEVQRELMPDEYQLVRGVQAEQIAAKILTPHAPEFPSVVGRILELTDTVFGWSQAQYIQEYPTLVGQVAVRLQLPLAPPGRPISYQELLDFLSSPYTVPLFQRIAVLPTVDPLPAEARAIREHPLADAVEGLGLIGLLNNLRVGVMQLAALVPVTQQIEVLAKPLRDPLSGRGEAFTTTLAQARDMLLATGQPSPEWQQLEAGFGQERREARLRVAGQLELVAGIMSPAQNDLIDWLAPADILAADIERVAYEQHRLLAEMRNVVDVLERLRFRRFRQIELYRRTRIGELNRLLERYGISQDSPLYPEYRSFGIDIFSRVRMMQGEDWEAAKILLASEFLRGVGVIEQPGVRPGGPKPVTWEDMYAAFTCPKAAQIIQQMFAARSGPGAAQ